MYKKRNCKTYGSKFAWKLIHRRSRVKKDFFQVTQVSLGSGQDYTAQNCYIF